MTAIKRKFIHPDFLAMTPRERGRLLQLWLAECQRRTAHRLLEAADANDPWLSTKAAAALVGRDEETIRLACKKKKLGHLVRSEGPKGRYWIRRSQLIGWWTTRYPGTPVPAGLRE